MQIWFPVKYQSLILTEKQCDGWKQYVTSPATFRRGKKKAPLLRTNYSLFNYLKIDKSAEAKRISSQIVESVIDRTVYHGTNFAPDIVNEIVNNVTRDVGSNNNDDSLSTEKCMYNI